MPAAQIITMQPYPNYTVGASLWAEQAIYNEEYPVETTNYQVSAANTNSKLLSSLLGSDTFLTNITDKIAASGYKISEKATNDLKTAINRGIKVTAKGDFLIQLEYQDRDNKLAETVLTATIDTFNDFIFNLLQTQGTASLSYLEQQVSLLKSQSDQATAKVKEFLANNPSFKNNDPFGNIPFLTEENFDFSLLQENQVQTKRQYDLLNEQLVQLRINFETLLNGKTTLATVRDKPSITSSVTYTSISRLILSASIGLGGGLLLTTFAVLLITWLDNSLYDIKKAKSIFKVSLVVSVPLQSSATIVKRSNNLTKKK